MAVNVVHTDNTIDSADRTTYTFSSQSIGTAAADRVVVVSILGRGNTRQIS